MCRTCRSSSFRACSAIASTLRRCRSAMVWFAHARRATRPPMGNTRSRPAEHPCAAGAGPSRQREQTAR
jgi:hypothetical protein